MTSPLSPAETGHVQERRKLITTMSWLDSMWSLEVPDTKGAQVREPAGRQVPNASKLIYQNLIASWSLASAAFYITATGSPGIVSTKLF